jgi:hypothetical protein
MNETRFDCEQSQQGIAAGAGVATISMTVPAGERWLVISASAVHNDALGPNCYWVITRGGAARQLNDPAALAANVRTHLYTASPTRDSYILRAGDVLSVVAAAMGGAANWTMQALYEVRRGETT